MLLHHFSPSPEMSFPEQQGEIAATQDTILPWSLPTKTVPNPNASTLPRFHASDSEPCARLSPVSGSLCTRIAFPPSSDPPRWLMSGFNRRAPCVCSLNSALRTHSRQPRRCAINLHILHSQKGSSHINVRVPLLLCTRLSVATVTHG